MVEDSSESEPPLELHSVSGGGEWFWGVFHIWAPVEFTLQSALEFLIQLVLKFLQELQHPVLNSPCSGHAT